MNLTKRNWGDRKGHYRGRWLGYVNSTKVIFSFRQKQKSISPAVRMVFFTRSSGNFEKVFCVDIRFFTEAPKELQPLWDKHAGAWRNINVCPPRIWTKENSNDNKQEFICFMCKQRAEKYRTVLHVFLGKLFLYFKKICKLVMQNHIILPSLNTQIFVCSD